MHALRHRQHWEVPSEPVPSTVFWLPRSKGERLEDLQGKPRLSHLEAAGFEEGISLGSQQPVGSGGFRQDRVEGRPWTGLETGKNQAPSGEEGGIENNCWGCSGLLGRAQVAKLILICPSVLEPGCPQAVLLVLCVRGVVLFKQSQ